MVGMATDSATDNQAGPDWGTDAPETGVAGAFLIEGIVALVGGAIGLFVAGPLIGVGVALALLVAAGMRVQVRGRTALRASGARPLAEGEGLRLRNIVAGLCEERGMTPPGLWLIPEGGPNAMVAWAGGGHMAVTASLIESFSRTETEAAVAHCLARISSGEARRTSLLVGVGFPRPERVGTKLDVMAVAITRYPPALIKVLERSELRNGRFAPLWLAGEPPSHEERAARIAALEDL